MACSGADFVASYPLIFILAAGLIVQASTGPAEAVLNMRGQERACALIYAVSFVGNLLACLLLIPQFGAVGASISATGALIMKSLLMFIVIKRRLSLHAFIWGGEIGRRVQAAN